jgi:hypothetical protein
MSEAPSWLFPSTRHAPRTPAGVRRSGRGSVKVRQTVDIIVPDEYCATLLLEQAESLFPAQIDHGPGWIVRLRPSVDRPEWVLELLALVDRWLALAPLPCVTLLYGGRRYLLRAPMSIANLVPNTATENVVSSGRAVT